MTTAPTTVPCVIEVPDPLRVENRQQFKREVLECLNAGHLNIVLDCTKTTYIDSSGLGVMLTLNRDVRGAGGTLTLRNLSEELHTVLELTKIEGLFAFEQVPPMVAATT
jgi:anti-sigma B factor antagonist